ncbi:predicted protein [Aspergillus terreus NIH2624]|uniref:Uncharacterized protein n=1 Tax=Aspergillus terreus (strain NIH 2624 / FGSC A1156) TaxID=341663 RepID=Q0C802_ASPTN|nr:uncharacterized protein ATEG_10182 [Aspergillus terreus NIH2624]EAU29631.1 predicted protein [Aspergillus terreus NIH2624]
MKTYTTLIMVLACLSATALGQLRCKTEADCPDDAPVCCGISPSYKYYFESRALVQPVLCMDPSWIPGQHRSAQIFKLSLQELQELYLARTREYYHYNNIIRDCNNIFW